MERIELSAESLQLDESVSPQKQEVTVFKLQMPSANRRIYYVDVGNYGKKDAEKYLDDLIVNYKRKEVPDDAGYFYCPYIPSMDLQLKITDTAKTITDLLATKIAAEIDEEIQTAVVDEAKSLWSHNTETALWDSISTASKLEALGIDKSFLEFSLDNECVAFEDECSELAEDIDEFEMMVEFNKIADPNWSEDRMAFALNLFKQGWKAKDRVEEETSYDPTFTQSFYYDNNAFFKREDIENAIIKTNLS